MAETAETPTLGGILTDILKPVVAGLLGAPEIKTSLAEMLGIASETFAERLADHVVNKLIERRTELAAPIKALQDSMPDSGDVRLPGT